jgi:hypothetical protein
MKRSIRAVLATSAALALTSLGVAPAMAAEPPQPASWQKVDDRYAFPAGSACKDRIKVHEKYKYRLMVLSESPTRASYREDIDGGWAKFYNPRTHKTVRIKLDSTAYIEENRVNATARIRDKGVGYWQGPGVKGLLYVKGTTYGKYVHLDDPDQTSLNIYKIKGKSVQLCYRLGSKPVDGKLVIPPSAQSQT